MKRKGSVYSEMTGAGEQNVQMQDESFKKIYVGSRVITENVVPMFQCSNFKYQWTLLRLLNIESEPNRILVQPILIRISACEETGSAWQ